MSHNDPKARIAALVHEGSAECLSSNCLAEISENSSGRVRSKGIEYKCPPFRNYDTGLKAKGEYYEKKRRAMQELSYSQAEIVEAGDQPSAEDYLKEVMQHREKKKKFFEQLFFLAFSDKDPKKESHMTKAKANVTMLMRLFRLDHNIMGKLAVNYIRQAVVYWESVVDGVNCKVEHLAAKGEPGYEPQLVRLNGQTFAQLMEEQQLIIIPDQCGTALPAATLNKFRNFPPRDMRNLPAFARQFGFNHAEDYDESGRNIFHHLFTALKYSFLAMEVAMHCFDEGEAVLQGDYRAAMRHKVTGVFPRGWTPLHILCHGSDSMVGLRYVIERLLETNTVPLSYFDAMGNDTVIVFGSLVAMVHNAHLVGLHPPLPRPHRSTPPPSTPWGSTGTYVRTHVRTYDHICRWATYEPQWGVTCLRVTYEPQCTRS